MPGIFCETNIGNDTRPFIFVPSLRKIAGDGDTARKGNRICRHRIFPARQVRLLIQRPISLIVFRKIVFQNIVNIFAVICFCRFHRHRKRRSRQKCGGSGKSRYFRNPFHSVTPLISRGAVCGLPAPLSYFATSTQFPLMNVNGI